MKWPILFIYFWTTCLWAQSAHDIIIKSRFDDESSKIFIEQLRGFLITNDFGDPYEQEFKTPISIELDGPNEELTDQTQSWLTDFQSAFKLNLVDSNYRLLIEGFGYKIGDFTTEFMPVSSQSKEILYLTMNRMKGIRLYARKISFEMELKRTNESAPIKFNVDLLGAEFDIAPELLLDMPMGWLTSILPEKVLLTLQMVNLEKVFTEILKRPDLVDFKIDGFYLPEVAVRIGNRTIKFDNAKIMTLMKDREDEMKSSIIELIHSRLGPRLSNIIEDSPRAMLLKKRYEMNSDISGIFDVHDMKTNNSRMLEVNIDGHFCEKQTGPTSTGCTTNVIPAKVRRTLDIDVVQRSLRLINRLLIEKTANIAFSVSEDYLNQLIQATIKAGLWESEFQGKKYRLGPETAFVLADEAGDSLSLYLDIIYTLKGAQRVLVGSKELRFPVKLKIGLKIQDVNGVPRLSITTTKVATDKNIILEGLPQYGLISNVKNARLKNKVLRTILEDIGEIQGSELLKLDLPEFKGNYLQRLMFFSDGLGRANATINFAEEKRNMR